jgi:hypothetical protein
MLNSKMKGEDQIRLVVNFLLCSAADLKKKKRTMPQPIAANMPTPTMTTTTTTAILPA